MSFLKPFIFNWMIWSCQSQLMLEEQRYSSHFLSKCLNSIIGRYKKNNVLYAVDLDLPLNSFPTIKINSNITSFKWFKYEKNNVCVINLEDGDLEMILENLLHFQTVDPRSNFVIVSKRKVDKSIFITASKYYIYHLLVMEVVSYSQQKLYSYKPYTFENVNEPQTDFYHLGTCSEGDLANDTNFPETDLPKQWRNTTINAFTRIFKPYSFCFKCKEKGMEIDIFEIAAHHLGLTARYIGNEFQSFWGRKIHGSYDHLMGALERREGDMVIGGFHMNWDENQDFDMSFAHMEDGIYWIVPKAKVLPNWKRLSLIFDIKIYLFLLLSSAVVVLMCKLVYHQSFASIIMILYRILVEASVPRIKGSRIIIVSWIASSMILSSIFKSKMMVILYQERYDYQIDSLKDIVSSGMTINIDKFIPTYYHKFANSEEEYVVKNYQHCKDYWGCINRTAFQKDAAAVVFLKRHEYSIPTYVDKNGNLPLHIVFEDPVVPMHLHLFFVKGYPIFPQIDQLLVEIRSRGFVELVYSRVKHKNNLALKRKSRLSVEVLGFEEVHVAFVVWCLGLFGSFLVFLLEVLV